MLDGRSRHPTPTGTRRRNLGWIALTAVLITGCDPASGGGSLAVSSASPIGSIPTASPTPSAAAVGGYLGLATGFDDATTEIQIANPLAEFDLVGARLIELIESTRQRLAALPPSGATAHRLRQLDVEMAATVDLLRAIDPHGPRDQTATRYQQALDYWVDHVAPITAAIRSALSLPPPPGGDLKL
jgi:hypothetical protein